MVLPFYASASLSAFGLRFRCAFTLISVPLTLFALLSVSMFRFPFRNSCFDLCLLLFLLSACTVFSLLQQSDRHVLSKTSVWNRLKIPMQPHCRLMFDPCSGSIQFVFPLPFNNACYLSVHKSKTSSTCMWQPVMVFSTQNYTRAELERLQNQLSLSLSSLPLNSPPLS